MHVHMSHMSHCGLCHRTNQITYKEITWYLGHSTIMDVTFVQI